MSVQTEVPSLVADLGVESEVSPRGRAAAGHIAVVGVDLTVVVAVHEGILYRIAFLVVNLLVQIISIRSVAGLVQGGKSYVATHRLTYLDSLEVLVAVGKLGDLYVLEGEVSADLPVPVSCLDGDEVGRKLYTLVHHTSDVRGQLLAEVRSERNGNLVQQIEGVAVVSLDATADAVVQEAEVHTDVVGLGGLPFDVGVVCQRRQHVERTVLSAEHRVLHGD